MTLSGRHVILLEQMPVAVRCWRTGRLLMFTKIIVSSIATETCYNNRMAVKYTARIAEV